MFLSLIEGFAPDQWPKLLDEFCGSNVPLRCEVERLLSGHTQELDLVKQGEAALREIIRAEDQPSVIALAGTQIGPYQLLEQIGEGGMGVVFMAEQVRPVRRRVALKVIKPGMDTREVIGRFEAERQALAMMEHPNIAKVHDAGATENGRPYFVMELVQGVPITDYCDQCNLRTRERLELFITVCQAVQHAHQKGVIHRDLKPTNILVAMQDGRPAPKIIDFGVAKAIYERLTEHTLATGFAQMIGTPTYMSPEQAELSPLGADTRSDIYSLGVLLYELLTGTTPFDKDRIHAASYDELRRIIGHEEPPRPSARLSTLAADLATTIAEDRRTDLRRLRQTVRGELDWIVMKCLEKDRNRRYETANDLARDIERYLHDAPVMACPPSTVYRLRKYARRNKVALTFVALLFAGLVFLAFSNFATRRERDAKAKALAQATIESARAKAVSDLLLDMLDSANPDKVKGVDYTVRELLDDFSAGLSSQLADQPEVEVEIRATIGRAYRRLGITEDAERNLKRALELRRRVYGPNHEKVAESLADYAYNLLEQGQNQQAEDLSREALDIYLKRGVVGGTVIFAYRQLQYSLIMQGRLELAETVSQDAMARALEWGLVDNKETAMIINGMVRLKYMQGKFVEGEEFARRGVEIHRRVHGDHHPETAWALRGLGSSLLGQRKYSEAESVLREALAIFRLYFSEEHKATGHLLGDLRATLERAGDQAELEALAREQIQHAANGAKRDAPHPYGSCVLGDAYADLKQWKSALDAYEKAFALTIKLAADYRPTIAISCLNLLRAVEIDASLPEDERAALVDKLKPRVNEFWSETTSEPPKSPLGKHRLVWSVVANPTEGFTDFHTAVELVQQAVAQEPKNAAYWNTLGVAHYRAGNFEDACKALLKSSELSDGGDCIAGCFLAMAHWHLGHKDEARKWYEQAVDWMEKKNHNDEELRRFHAEAAELLGITERQTSDQTQPVENEVPNTDKPTPAPPLNPEP